MFRIDSRMLIIDDASSSRDAVRVALNQMGYKSIDEAGNGKAGLDKIRRAASENKPYSLVFADINMPEVDGLQMLENIRADESISSTPVVIITAEGSKTVVIKAVMSGIAGYIVKPFGVEEIQKKVQELGKKVSR